MKSSDLIQGPGLRDINLNSSDTFDSLPLEVDGGGGATSTSEQTIFKNFEDTKISSKIPSSYKPSKFKSKRGKDDVKSVEPPLAISSNSAGGSLSFLNHNKSNDRSGGKNESSESTSNDNKSQEKIKGIYPITVEKKLQTKAALISAKGFKPFILDKAANTRQKMNAKYLKS
jgi:hypothetical protein